MQMGMGDLEPAYQSFQPEGALQPSHSRFVIKGVRHSSSLGMRQKKMLYMHLHTKDQTSNKWANTYACAVGSNSRNMKKFLNRLLGLHVQDQVALLLISDPHRARYYISFCVFTFPLAVSHTMITP